MKKLGDSQKAVAISSLQYGFPMLSLVERILLLVVYEIKERETHLRWLNIHNSTTLSQ